MDNQRVLLKMIKIYSTPVNLAKHNHFRPLPLVGALYIRTEEINSKWTLVSVGCYFFQYFQFTSYEED